MNDELRNISHPVGLRLFWIAVYILISLVCIVGLYFTATQIKTHVLPVGKVLLTIPYSKYVVGETISFTITNNYNSPLYVLNNCPNEPLAVYRLQDSSWVRQHDTASLEECPTEDRQVSVAANAVTSGDFSAWHNLFSQPGKYRVVAYVEYYNALPYQEFEVIAKPLAKTVSSPTTAPSTSTQPQTTTPPVTQTVTPQLQPTTTFQEPNNEPND